MTDAGETATDLLDRALGDPAATVEEATLKLAVVGGNSADRAVLLRARGLAHRLLGDLSASEADLHAGTEVARDAGLRSIELGLSLTLAGTHVFQGDTARALELLRDCVEKARGELKAESLFQLGTTYAQAGDLDKAIEIYARALPLIRRHGRQDWASNLLGNRGIMHFHRGDYAASIRDLDRAIALQIELDIPAQAAINMLNKAQALFMSGRIAASLDLYREAESLQDALRMPVLMHAQKCETFLAAGLFEDCLELARISHGFHHQGQLTIGAIRSLLPGAEAALALGRYPLAVELAEAVHKVPGADSFPLWLARADLTRLEARVQQGATVASDIDVALAIHRETAGGDSSTAGRAEVVAAEIALHLGLTERSLELLEDSARRIRRCPLHLQMYRWGVVAVARAALDNQRGALAAVRAGLRAFDRLLLGVTSFDVRARATRHAETLTQVGVRAHVSRSRFDDAVELIARVRSGPIDAPRPNANSRPVGSTPERRPGPAPTESVVTWVELDDELLCIHQTASTTTVHPCGALGAIKKLIDDHTFVHRQLARKARLSTAVVADLLERRDAADDALNRQVLPAGLQPLVVLAPSASLMGLCWGSLADLRERPHVVSMSLALARRTIGKPLKRATVIGSNRLAHVEAEVAAVAGQYGSQPREEIGSLSTLRSARGSDVLHLAGHFVATGSDPLLSGVALDAQTFRGQELLELRRPPPVVVLSACASSATEAVGAAAIGFATAALAAGSACVVATQTLIEDGGEVVHAMSDLHRLLASGVTPAHALHALRTTEERGSQIARTLVAIGSGW